jgi:DNA-binding FadR family transcriptional regulator
MQLRPLLELAAAYQAAAHHTEDHHEAISAFLEKRAPEFRNQ